MTYILILFPGIAKKLSIIIFLLLKYSNLTPFKKNFKKKLIK